MPFQNALGERGKFKVSFEGAKGSIPVCGRKASDDESSTTDELWTPAPKPPDFSVSVDEESVNGQVGDFVALQVSIRLKDGVSLAIRDASGSSDPYVKFKYGGRVLYKSATIFRNLNPTWDEEFSVLVDELYEPFDVEVFDYDRLSADDFMGSCRLDLSSLRYFVSQDLILSLKDGEDDTGYLNIAITIAPVTAVEREKAKSGVLSETKKPGKLVQVWSSVVNIVLVEGKGLHPPPSASGLPDPFVRFKLANEKYKSKVASRTVDPTWLEQFDLHVFDNNEQILEIMVNDKRNNYLLGKLRIDLNLLPQDETVQRWWQLEDGAGALLLLLTISGRNTPENILDIEETTQTDVRQTIVEQYDLKKSMSNFGDVGQLRVKVFKARSLLSKDIGGKSDPFVVLQLVNSRLQTRTEYNTLEPEWNQLFVFAVKDIHAILEVVVFDWDTNGKREFLGRVNISLLAIRNCERTWFTLKDQSLSKRAKGEILLELDVIWNPVKAAVRTINPREKVYMQRDPKFSAAVLKSAVNELKEFGLAIASFKNRVFSLFTWESPVRSFLGFVFYVTFVYWAELYYIPIVLLCIFLNNYLPKRLMGRLEDERSQDIYFFNESGESFEEEDENSPPNSSTKKSGGLASTLLTATDTLAVIQNGLVNVVETLQRHFQLYVPLSLVFGHLCACVVTLILYFVPFRWILMIWGVNKFTKKLRKPNSIPNNEIFDFLSRVPCDRELRQQRNLRREPTRDERLPRQKKC